MVKEKIPSWQITKNILDLEYRDIKDSINNRIIILATLTIAFSISFLQDSFPKNLKSQGIVIIFAIISILTITILDKKNSAKEKLKEIAKLKK